MPMTRPRRSSSTRPAAAGASIWMALAVPPTAKAAIKNNRPFGALAVAARERISPATEASVTPRSSKRSVRGTSRNNPAAQPAIGIMAIMP